MTRLVAVLLIAAGAACAREVVPAPLDPANTACASCRMTVSDQRFAAQIAAPGAEPLFFDDIGCLRDYLAKPGVTIPADAVAFVADHRTKEWVPAVEAVYTRPVRITTPMGGGVIAHASEDSRRQDVDSAAGTRLTLAELFGPSRPPDGGRK